MSESRVVFLGPGPFHLPVPQSATAHVVGGAIEIRIKASVDGDPNSKPIAMQLTGTMAHKLGLALLAAASELESKA
jgi:hypothetical protein